MRRVASDFSMTKPCDNCPFRIKGGIRIHPERVKEIATGDHTFECHKSAHAEHKPKHGLHCAGFLIFRERTNTSTNAMRMAERLGLYDRSKLDLTSRDVFRTLKAMLKKNEGEQR